MNEKDILKRLSKYFAALIALIVLMYISAIPVSVSAAYYNDTFDLDKAQKYAKTWAHGRNTDEYFSHHDNDCANFVSQILIAGGIPETSYFHASKSYSSLQTEQTESTKNVPSLIQYFRSMYGVAYYNKKSALSVGSISAETYMAGSNSYDGVTKNACDGHSFGINNIEPGDCVTITGTYGRSHIVYVLSVDKKSNAIYFAAHTRDAYNETYNLSIIDGVLKTSDLVAATSSPEISISEPNTSGTIYYGDNFNMYGIISSGLPLTSVKAGFYDCTGKSIYEYNINPQGSTTYNISGTSIQYLPVGVHKLTITASNSEKTNVTLYEKTFAVLSHNKTLDNGTYKISASYNSTYLMGAAGGSSGDNVNLYVDESHSGYSKNIWYIQNEGDGYYLIRNFKSGCFLDVASGLSTDGTNVSQWNLNRGIGQLWQILPAGGGTYCLVPKCATESCADVNSGNNSNIEIYGLHLGVNQCFAFTQTDGNFTDGNKITFNANGGILSSSAYASHTVDGVNKDIDAGGLIIYNIPNQTINLANANYVMTVVNSNGRCSRYASGESATIPKNGFAVVGHDNGGNDGASFLEQVQLADYLGYNSSTKTVYVYKTQNRYLTNHKYVESGSVYGDLPVPIRAGYDFDGWYTSASGGTKVTSNSYYSTSTLYAHWKTASGVVQINSATFPDDNFRAYVSKSIDDDKSGWLSEDEITYTWTINVDNKGINNLTGIEYFTSLQYLYCKQNNLTSIDLSKNKNLKILRCSYNKLVSLDLSNNTNLTHIFCFKNNLVNVNVSNTKAIETSFICTSDSQGTAGTENNFNIGTVKSSYSLSNLTKYGFNPAKASNWNGATYNPSSNSLTNFTSTKISYDYDCGNGLTATFYLVADIILNNNNGDLNNDGKVDLKDLAVMKNILAEDDTSQYADSADLNDDGKINLRDLAALKYLLASN